MVETLDRHKTYMGAMAVCKEVKKQRLLYRGKQSLWDTWSEEVSYAELDRQEAKTAYKTAYDKTSEVRPIKQ